MASPNPTGVDAYRPAEIARLVEEAGVAKAGLELLPLTVLSLLAGAFIGFGAVLSLVVTTGAGDLFGPARLLGGLAFSLGLVLVVVGGAELFTGNALIVIGWVDRRVGGRALLRNWAVAYAGNLGGALGLVVLLHAAGTLDLGGGAVGATAARIVAAKLALSPVEAFARGILCNALVCLAVWLAFAARDVASRILAIVFPVTAFVALGFEHSVANMALLPLGVLGGAEASPAAIAANLVLVTAGNVVGGAGGVGLVYWSIYLRGRRPAPQPSLELEVSP